MHTNALAGSCGLECCNNIRRRLRPGRDHRLPAFMNFYYQDLFLLAALPAILSIILGLRGHAHQEEKKADIFPLLGAEISEKSKNAYDNREVDSLPMQAGRGAQGNPCQNQASEMLTRDR